MVVIELPSAWTARQVHDRTATPSSRTVQAPHWLVSQPILVPVTPPRSRMKWTSSSRGSTSRWYRRPLMVRSIGTFTRAPPISEEQRLGRSRVMKDRIIAGVLSADQLDRPGPEPTVASHKSQMRRAHHKSGMARPRRGSANSLARPADRLSVRSCAGNRPPVSRLPDPGCPRVCAKTILSSRRTSRPGSPDSAHGQHTRVERDVHLAIFRTTGSPA